MSCDSSQHKYNILSKGKMKRRMIFNWLGLSFLFLLMELLKLFEDKNEISILISNEGKQALIVLITTPIIEIRKSI